MEKIIVDAMMKCAQRAVQWLFLLLPFTGPDGVTKEGVEGLAEASDEPLVCMPKFVSVMHQLFVPILAPI
jgi:hypothetical protein